jgi:hypothetical protein
MPKTRQEIKARIKAIDRTLHEFRCHLRAYDRAQALALRTERAQLVGERQALDASNKRNAMPASHTHARPAHT